MQSKVDVAVMIGSGVPASLRALGQSVCWVVLLNGERRGTAFPVAMKRKSAGLPGWRNCAPKRPAACIEPEASEPDACAGSGRRPPAPNRRLHAVVL